MGKSSKKVKKVVGAANDIARGVRARQAAEIDALPAAGGGELSAADAEGSAGESMVPGGTGPPARSVLEDEGPRPDDEASGQAGVAVGANGARPTIEQEGAEVRRIATEIAVANQLAAAAAVGVERAAVAKARAAERGEVGYGDPEYGGRKGHGAGYGVFDARYTRAEGEDLFARYGRKYKESNEWSPVAAQYWEDELAQLRLENKAEGRTLRLFKVAWQGNELSREAIVRVLQQVLIPIGEVQGTMGVRSDLFDSKGVRANAGEEVLGYGGGFYVPILMRHLNLRASAVAAEHQELWGGEQPGYSEESGPGGDDGVTQLWDCPAEYFTVGVPMVQGDGVVVVHNLCVSMSWCTLETLREPERLGNLRGDWRLEGVDVRKREETQMIRLAAALGKLGPEYAGMKLQLRQEWVDGVRLQQICGVSPPGMGLQAEQVAGKLVYGVNIEWQGEQRPLATGKPDELVVEKGQFSRAGGAKKVGQAREDENPRKLVIKPLAKHLKGQMWADRLEEVLEATEGVDGVESVGFSPDRHPGFRNRGVVAFVVFKTVEQRDAVLELGNVIWGLYTTDFQLEEKRMEIKAADTGVDKALDRQRSQQPGGGKRHRGVEVAVPKPLDKQRTGGVGVWAGGGQASGRDSGGGTGGPTIADEQGVAMDRGGEEAIGRMEQEAGDRVMVRLSEQMRELFGSLAVKQDEENRRLREENMRLQRQMVEQNSRIEQMMVVLMGQRGGDQLIPVGPAMQPASPASTEVTPVKGRQATVVMPALPGTQGPASLEKRDRSAVVTGQPGAEAIAEMVRSNQAMRAALQDVLAAEGGGAGMAHFMQSNGHGGVIGMIESGGVMPPGAQ